MVTGDTSVKKQVQDRSNLIVRSITALVAGPLVLMVVYLGGWPFAALAFFLAAMSLVELYALGQGRGFQGSILVGIPLLIALVVSYAAQQYILLPVLFVIAGLVAFSLETLRRNTADFPAGGAYRFDIGRAGVCGFPGSIPDRHSCRCPMASHGRWLSFARPGVRIRWPMWADVCGAEHRLHPKSPPRKP